MLAETAVSPVRNLADPATMGRPAHHLVADAERIHDVERQQRDMRGLQQVAAGVEDEVRRGVAALIVAAAGSRDPLAEPRQNVVVELHARLHGDLAIELAEGLDALAALVARLGAGLGHGQPRHGEHEARIDPISRRP